MPETYPSEEDDVPPGYRFTIDDPIPGTVDSRIERVARAIAPEVFRKPRINLYRDDYERAYAKAQAAIAAIEDTGYRIVPKEATDEMVEAGWCDGRPGSMWETYRRMVNAAPPLDQ
jgi:hypothetical protein